MINYHNQRQCGDRVREYRQLAICACLPAVLLFLAACSAHPQTRPAAHAGPPPGSAIGPALSPGPIPTEASARPWVVQPVAGDAHPQAASVAEALKTGKHPERLSMMVEPAIFDAGQYALNPQSYLDTIEPGRVFQTAQPGPDVPELVPAGATAASILPNQSVDVAVITAPGAPVSWSSLDLGSFQNGLNAITVPADRTGKAAVTFTATPGVSHLVHILAGSPLASGQVAFQVDVQTQGIVPVPPSDPQP